MKKVGSSIIIASLLLNAVSPLVVSAAELSESNEQTSPVISEVTTPIIDPTTITVSQQRAAKGDILTYSVPVPVTDVDVDSQVVLTLSNSDSEYSEEFMMTYQAETNRFEAQVELNDEVPYGVLSINKIELIENGESRSIWAHDEETFNLQAYDVAIVEQLTVQSLVFSKKEAKLGDKVDIFLKMDNQTELQDVTLNLYNPAVELPYTVVMEYNPGTEQYEGSVEIIEDVMPGKWEVSQIEAFDLDFNYILLRDELAANNVSQYFFTVNELQADEESPLLHKDTIQVSQKEAQVGSTVTYRVKLTDNEAIKAAHVRLIHEDEELTEESGSGIIDVPFVYNESNGLYEASFTVDQNTKLGTWKILYFHAIDEAGNPLYFQNGNIYLEDYYGMSMQQFDVVVTEKIPNVIYSSHVQSIGWQDAVQNGEMSGTSGARKRLEAIKISLDNLPMEGSIEYQTHVESYGWMDWAKNGDPSGMVGKAKRLEAIRIKLTGEIAEQYDVYYRVHAESYGWLGWAKNGEDAGTEGLAKRLEAIEIQLVKKGEPAPGPTTRPFVMIKPVVSYTTHVEKKGWQDYVSNGAMSGTEGEALRLEAIKITASDLAYTGGIEYRTHIQSIGWQAWKSNNELSGTEGEALRLEAIQMKLTGELAKKYDIYYRVHAQSFGWLGWAKNGESAGTEGLALRLEGIEVQLVKKGGQAPGTTTRPFVVSKPTVNYTTHVQKQGWQSTVSNGKMSGTSGLGLRLEGILMNVFTQSLSGTIQYRTHVQKEGWQDWTENWQLSGTQGKGLRLEAIQIKLTEEMAKFYDVYYRVHAQSYGWLGWAKNGESAGTEGLAKRLEGIEVRLVRKGEKAPGSTNRAFVKK
ncbi:hypothetical protein [Jeotgalibaca caeni]|uniref:hypothetical protein n=1 Tax=Jeotgalibaca caeni TaxID=3028623 RepID=UPI00237E9424|nr:hypothetical protein [Jeotgalibaca caeni]MDE1548167.1 hypothetical protein [Jeotgalibaca caeni]